MEVRTIVIVLMTLLVLGILGVTVYELYSIFSPSGSTSSTTPVKSTTQITTSLTSAKTSQTVTTPLPPSLNEDSGIEYSYAFWFYIQDFSSNTAAKTYLLTKGDLLTAPTTEGTLTATASPAIYFDSTNTLHVTQDTYSSPLDIAVPYIPANVLIHVAVVVTQSTMSVYINGIIKEYQIMDIPKQNTGAVNIVPGTGFNGMIGPITYYNYALENTDIVQLSMQPPKVPPSNEPAAPPYFNSQWYVNN